MGIASTIAGVIGSGGQHEDRDTDRAYRLRTDEHVPDGMRRIARGQLLDAHDELSGAARHDLATAVHETRKRLKRVRACVRLARDAIGDETYRHENASLRDAGRRIAAQRDAQVRLDTLDALTKRFADELPRSTTAALRSRLEHERALAASSAAGDDDASLAAARDALDAALVRTPAWTFERDGFDALAPGLRRIYRQGRKRMRAARKDPSPDNLHDLRKRVKDLRHATEVVRGAQPKRLKRISRRAHALGDTLGDGHDLSELRAYIEAHPGCFADDASREAVLSVIDRRSDVLRAKVLDRAERLFKRSPKRFVGRIEDGWHKRAAARPRPLAG